MAYNDTSWTSDDQTKAGASSTTTSSFTTGTLIANTLQLSENVIKASDGGSTITLDTSDNITIAGGLTATGATQLNNTLTVGVDGTGHDVKFFGDSSGSYMLWDESDERLKLLSNHNGPAGLLLQSDAARSTADAPDMIIKKNSTPNADDYLGSIKFQSKDAGGSTDYTYAEIDTFATEVTDGAAEGALFINVLANGGQTQSLKCRGLASGLSTVECTDGDLQVGVNTVTQGMIRMKRKDVNEFPYIEMVSADGTSSFLFVANDGTLRIHSAAPTANTDGAAV